MTEKILDWLNHNRFRAYPFVNNSGLIVNGKRIPDCVLLDCIVMDTRHYYKNPELVFTEIDINDQRTKVTFEYNGNTYSYDIDDQTSSSNAEPGESSIVRVDGTMISGMDNELFFIKLVFSSHNYILQTVGTGKWNFTGKVMPSKVVTTTASGVMGVHVNGSKHVEGFDTENTITGDVRLVDGFRTQPVIQNGKIIVKVGTKYGEDPCHYRENDEDYSKKKKLSYSCNDVMLFFCGQNAIDSGNVILEGGPGITVKQGSTYTVKYDIIDTYGKIGARAGEKIPCVEIIADPSLLKMYRPSAADED